MTKSELFQSLIPVVLFIVGALVSEDIKHKIDFYAIAIILTLIQIAFILIN